MLRLCIVLSVCGWSGCVWYYLLRSFVFCLAEKYRVVLNSFVLPFVVFRCWDGILLGCIVLHLIFLEIVLCFVFCRAEKCRVLFYSVGLSCVPFRCLIRCIMSCVVYGNRFVFCGLSHWEMPWFACFCCAGCVVLCLSVEVVSCVVLCCTSLSWVWKSFWVLPCREMPWFAFLCWHVLCCAEVMSFAVLCCIS